MLFFLDSSPCSCWNNGHRERGRELSCGVQTDASLVMSTSIGLTEAHKVSAPLLSTS